MYKLGLGVANRVHAGVKAVVAVHASCRESVRERLSRREEYRGYRVNACNNKTLLVFELPLTLRFQ